MHVCFCASLRKLTRTHICHRASCEAHVTNKCTSRNVHPSKSVDRSKDRSARTSPSTFLFLLLHTVKELTQVPLSERTSKAVSTLKTTEQNSFAGSPAANSALFRLSLLFRPRWPAASALGGYMFSLLGCQHPKTRNLTFF